MSGPRWTYTRKPVDHELTTRSGHPGSTDFTGELVLNIHTSMVRALDRGPPMSAVDFRKWLCPLLLFLKNVPVDFKLAEADDTLKLANVN